MKRLSRQQITEKAQHVSDVQEAKQELEEAIAKYNETMEAAKGPVEAAVEKLNDAISAADEWRANISSEQDSYYDERSEKWQEGEAGSNYSDWKDSFSSEFEQVEVSFPDELEVPDCSVDEDIDQMADEPGVS